MKYIIISVLAFFTLFNSCKVADDGEYYRISGFTQGTSYHITYQHPTEYDLKGKVDTLLRQFDLSLSSYEPASIISRINRNEDVETDSLFRAVFRESARVYQETGGAFDITSGPLIRVWKKAIQESARPGNMEIEEALKDIREEDISKKYEGAEYYAKDGNDYAKLKDGVILKFDNTLFDGDSLVKAIPNDVTMEEMWELYGSHAVESKIEKD